MFVQRLWMRYYFALRFTYRCLFDLYSDRLAPPDTLMRLNLAGWIVPAALLFVFPVAAQGATTPIITSPTTGQALQGQVAITGTTDIPDFASAELDFSYTTDETNTRFPIQTMTDPIANNLLANWDTTTISDGEYLLQLRVFLADGTVQEMSFPVQIRNYSVLLSPTPPALTAIPTKPVLQIPTPIVIPPSATPTAAPLPTPTLLPMNPAVTNSHDVYSGFWRGGLVVLIIFIAFGIALRLRRS
jgi:hypothetical protein